ncbi:MAG: serine/threonine-protein phosphatase [Candidatus Aenigmatarchaeota archaeon]
MKVLFSGKSVKGKDHEENEDGMLLEPELKLFAVADGVSIPKDGKEASRKVLKYLKENFKGNLKEAIEKTNKAFVEEKWKEVFEGYTTIAAVHLKENSVEACNVGDSPIFLIRKNKVESLAFIDKILGTSTLTQAMGEEFIKVHFFEKELKVGDFILLATDGITDVLGEEEIAKLLKNENNLERIVEKIIEEAEKKASFYQDDKTLVLIKVVG